MLTTLLNGALKTLTDFGAGEILILLFVVGYYELRFKNMNKKQEETDYNVISLENSTLKNVSEVRSESQKRLDYFVDRLQSGEASTEEMLTLVVRSMIALKTDFLETLDESYLTMKEFRRQQHDDNMHNSRERAASSERTQAVFDEIRDEFKRVNLRINELVTSQTNMGTFGKGPAPANYGKVSRRKPILSPIEPQEEVLEESLARIEPMLEIRETNTEFHDLNIEEMEAEDPEKHVYLVPITQDEPNIIDVLEERIEEL